MNDIQMRYLPVKFMNSGKHDYDDGHTIHSNAENKRIKRKLKKRRNRINDKFAYNDL